MKAREQGTSTKELNVDDELTIRRIQGFIDRTWDVHKVGKGKDARFAYQHKRPKVTCIKRVVNTELKERYSKQANSLLQRHKEFPDIGNLPGSRGQVTRIGKKFRNRVDYGINECYLFHGFPEKYLKSVVKAGLTVSASDDTDTMGEAIYFADSSTKADQYAGTELKMVLTRVLLGNVFSLDKAHPSLQKDAERLKGPPPGYDSVMVDDGFLFREFAVYHPSLCCPEYIITYKRVEKKERKKKPKKKTKTQNTDVKDQRPYVLRHVDRRTGTYKSIERLIQETWEDGKVNIGKDAQFPYPHPHRIRVKSIQRVDNQKLFETYKVKTQSLTQSSDIGQLTGSRGGVKTTEKLDYHFKRDLASTGNEHFLLHGFRKEYLETICKKGINPLSSSPKAMLGQAAYFAESSIKADQYTDKKDARTPLGSKLKMVLARVCLGKVCILDRSHPSVKTKDAEKLKGPPHDYDSVMADGHFLFREFAVYDSALSYPQYIINYVREPKY